MSTRTASALHARRPWVGVPLSRAAAATAAPVPAEGGTAADAQAPEAALAAAAVAAAVPPTAGPSAALVSAVGAALASAPVLGAGRVARIRSIRIRRDR